MGVLIKIDGVTFDPKNVIDTVEIPDEPIIPDEPVVPVTLDDYPVTDTLKGLYDLGGTAESTLVNHAPEPHANTADETLDGNPEMADDWVVFSGASSACRMSTYLQNDPTKKVTFVALFSVPAGQNPSNRVIIGNRRAGTGSTYFGLSLLNDCMRYGANGAIAEIKYPSAINSDKFAILALTADANGCRVVRYTNDALATLAEYSGAVEPWSINKTQIGGDSTSNNYGDAKISLAAIHEGDMTDEQLESICRFVYNYGKNTKGLTIE